MKVSEFIEYLKTLDQDRNIWINYDMCFALKPIVEEADDIWEGKSGVKEHDYMIMAY